VPELPPEPDWQRLHDMAEPPLPAEVEDHLEEAERDLQREGWWVPPAPGEEVTEPPGADLADTGWPPCARCHHLRQHSAVHDDHQRLIAVTCPGCPGGTCLGWR